MLVILGTIQVGVWWHVRLTLGEAAASAADYLVIPGNNPSHAEHVAQRVAAVGGVDALTVETHRGATQVRVVVQAQAPLLVDLGMADIEASAIAPVEAVHP